MLRFIVGWTWWHMRAFVWYIGLALRLFFAIGLDRDVHVDQEPDMSRHFRCPYQRTYRRWLSA